MWQITPVLEKLLINRPKSLKGDEPSAWRSDRPDTGGSTRRRKPDTRSTEAAAPARYVNIYSQRFLYVYAYILNTSYVIQALVEEAVEGQEAGRRVDDAVCGVYMIILCVDIILIYTDKLLLVYIIDACVYGSCICYL